MPKIGGEGFEWPDDWFRSNERIEFAGPLRNTLPDWWNATIYEPYGLTPHDIGETLIKGLDYNNKVVFRTHNPQKGEISIEISGHEAGALVYLMGQTVYMKEIPRRSNVDLVGVEDRFQRRGIGSTFMGNLREVALSLGVRVLTIKASLEHGPYVWVKFGFVPSPEEWKRVKEDIKKKLDSLEGVENKVRLRVERMLKSDNPILIRAIMREEAKVMSAHPGKPLDRREVPLGMALLADSGIHWYGAMNLYDDASAVLYDRSVKRNKP